MMSGDGEESEVEVDERIVQLLQKYGDSVLGEDDTGKNRRKKDDRTSKKCSKPKKIDIISEKDKKKKRLFSDVNQKVKDVLSEVTQCKKRRKATESKSEVEEECAMDVSEEEWGSESESFHDDGDDINDYSDVDDDDDDDYYSDNEKTVTAPMKKGLSKKLKQMEEELGLNDKKFLEFRESKKQVEEKKSVCGADLRPIQLTRPPPEVVVFESQTKKSKKPDVAAETVPKAKKEKRVPFNFEDARRDVRRFGIDGLKGEDKETAMTALLIKLGAKPLKNKKINYKELQKKKREEKEAVKIKREEDRSMGYSVSNAKQRYSAARDSAKRDRNDVGRMDGQLGTYKRGVQKLSKREIASVEKKQTKKHNRR